MATQGNEGEWIAALARLEEGVETDRSERHRLANILRDTIDAVEGERNRAVTKLAELASGVTKSATRERIARIVHGPACNSCGTFDDCACPGAKTVPAIRLTVPEGDWPWLSVLVDHAMHPPRGGALGTTLHTSAIDDDPIAVRVGFDDEHDELAPGDFVVRAIHVDYQNRAIFEVLERGE